MNNNLKQAIRKLRICGLLPTLELRLKEAAIHQLTHEHFLELVLQDELHVRAQRKLQQRKTTAGFRELKPLEEFDWQFNPSISRSQIYELAAGHFVRENRDLLLLGPPGVGKSCLAQAIGYGVIRAGFQVLYCSVFDLVRQLQADASAAQAQENLNRYLRPDLLVIDDFGMKHFPPKCAESLLEIVIRRHQNRSTLMTSNRPVEEWGQLLGDAPAATAILDRFLQQATILQITGRSYRLSKTRAATTPAPTPAPQAIEQSSPQAH